MKMYITGAEFEYSDNVYKIKYKDEIIEETKDRWHAIAVCLNYRKLNDLLEQKHSNVH